MWNWTRWQPNSPRDIVSSVIVSLAGLTFVLVIPNGFWHNAGIGLFGAFAGAAIGAWWRRQRRRQRGQA